MVEEAVNGRDAVEEGGDREGEERRSRKRKCLEAHWEIGEVRNSCWGGKAGCEEGRMG